MAASVMLLVALTWLSARATDGATAATIGLIWGPLLLIAGLAVAGVVDPD